MNIREIINSQGTMEGQTTCVSHAVYVCEKLQVYNFSLQFFSNSINLLEGAFVPETSLVWNQFNP